MFASRRWHPLLPVLFMAACQDDITPVSRQVDPGSPSAVVAIASDGFYFLPPMVPAPTSSPGEFDPTRHPRVRIVCTGATGQSCPNIAILEFGTGPSAVKLDLETESYNALWHARSDLTLGAGQYRLIVEENGAQLAQADLWVVESQKDAKVVPSDFLALVRGFPFQIRFRIEKTESAGTPGSAEVGPAGGFVEGILAGGGTMRLDVPGGAVTGPTTFTLVPKPPPPGLLRAFGLGPAGLQLGSDATLTLVLPPSVPVTDNTTVLYFFGTQRIYLPTARDIALGKLVVKLDRLGVPPSALLAALRMSGPAAAETADEASFAVVNASGNEIFAQAQAALNGISTTSSLNELNAMSDLLSNAAIFPATGDLVTIQDELIGDWRDRVCGLSAEVINGYALLSVDAPFGLLEYKRETEKVVPWIAAVFPLSDPSLELPFLGCETGIPDGINAIRDLTLRFIERLKQIVDQTDILIRFDEILDTRIPEILDLERDLALLGLGQLAPEFDVVISRYLGRLRAPAYGRCRDAGEYRWLGRLIALEEQGTVEDLTPYTLQNLAGDAQQCGTNMTWTVEDASSFASGSVGGGPAPDTPVLSADVNLGTQQTLKLSGTVRPLFCVTNSPTDGGVGNQETLLLRLRAGGTESELGPLTVPLGPANYVATPFTVAASEIRTAAGLAPDQAGEAKLEAVRLGNTCDFPMYEANLGSETILATLSLTLPPEQCAAPAAALSTRRAGLRTGTGARAAACASVAVTSAQPENAVARGQPLRFTATVTGIANTSVTWSATGGSIDPTGLYTAGTTLGTFAVTATSVGDPTASATVSVNVVTGIPIPPVFFSLSGPLVNDPPRPLHFTIVTVNFPIDSVQWGATASSIDTPNETVLLTLQPAGPIVMTQYIKNWTLDVDYPNEWQTDIPLFPGLLVHNIEVIVCAWKNGAVLRDATGNLVCRFSPIIRIW